MDNEDLKREAMAIFRSVNSSLSDISWAFNTDRTDSHLTWKSTPLEQSLGGIKDAISDIGDNSGELANIDDSIGTAAARISGSIDTAATRIESAIDRHARATKRAAMTPSERSTIDDACVEAIKEIRFHDLKALIQSGANVHHRVPGTDRTLFCLACVGGYKPIIQFLLKNNATTGDRDATGKTPLDYASESCAKETIKMIKAHGAR